MHLKSLELTGFKSFAEARIEFPQGVTAVVGPNGTGKSNVVDAILWVLGEQSAKTLRSERMEDVIFNGTEARKPMGMVEVSLIMSGVSEERLGGIQDIVQPLGEFHEIMVTRRLYRNGESEYLLNKTACRLKDVRSLLLDTRAGTKGHTIIEQGRIEQILNASPQDRRELIEETAGIVRYKKQKAEALRKLDSTQQNLLRVRDIITEVRRQLNSLERQARQARSYQTLQQQAKGLEIRLLARECRTLLAGQALVEDQLGGWDTEEAAQLAEQARLTHELEEVRLSLIGNSEALDRIRAEVGRLERDQAQALTAAEVEKGRCALYEQQQVQTTEELSRLAVERDQTAGMLSELRVRLEALRSECEQAELTLATVEQSGADLTTRRTEAQQAEERARREIIGLMAQLTTADNQLATLTTRDEEIGRRIERLQRELAETAAKHSEVSLRLGTVTGNRQGSERDAESLKLERAAASAAVQQLESDRAEAEQIIGRRQEELAAMESRLSALQSVVREEMGYGREGEEHASLRTSCEGVRESVAEWLSVSAGYERAVEAVLGERMHAWLVRDAASGRAAIDFLKAQSLGRGAFVPMGIRCEPVAKKDETWWPLLQGQPGVLERACDVVQAGEQGRSIAAWLFDGVVIVEHLEAALRQWERGGWQAPAGPTFVTLDGEIVDAAGIMVGGSTSPGGGVLQRRREIRRLEEDRQRLIESLKADRACRDRMQADGQSAKTRLEKLSVQIREMEMHAVGLVKDEAAFKQDLDELRRRRETIETERRSDSQERERLRAEIAQIRTRAGQLRDAKMCKEDGLTESQGTLARLDAEQQALQQRLTEARVALQSLRGRREHGEGDLARLEHEQVEQQQRIAALTEQAAGLEEAARASRVEQERNMRLVSELQAQVSAARQQQHAAQEAHSTSQERAGQLERVLNTVREGITRTRQQKTGLEIRRAELKTQLAALDGTLTGTYQLAMADAIAQEEALEAQVADGQPAQADSGEPVSGEATDGDGSQDPSAGLRGQLQKLRDRLERLGPINLASIDEHRELEERHQFLTTQEEDLSRSVTGLKEIISRINRTTKELFLETFNELQQRFGEVFTRFFPGGRAELILVEPEIDPETGAAKSDEPGVDIAAQPPGKRLKSLAMLSGGEKTLTAMALIFASFLIRPTPFCILDEIDAPLDEENIGRFTSVLRELSASAQFVVITHNKRTMAIADSLFGVTMEEPGVSKLVSVRLADLQPA